MAVSTAGTQLPRFLCVGAQKAGTTTLHSLLNLHPDIYLPPQKELQYFSLHYAEGLEWYENCFAAATPGQCIGEITPYYLFHPYVAERIAKDLGNIRIIILLRDPVNRTLSHYAHACRHGFENLPIKQALAMEKSRLSGFVDALKKSNGRHKKHQECSYLSRSLYRNQVQRYWDVFGSQNIILIPSESLFASPWITLQKIYSFLGVSACAKPDDKILNIRKNQGLFSDLHGRSFKDTALELRQQLDDSYRFASDVIGWECESLNWISNI